MELQNAHPGEIKNNNDLLSLLEFIPPSLHEYMMNPEYKWIVEGLTKVATDSPMFLDWIKRIVFSLSDSAREGLARSFVGGVIIQGQTERQNFLKAEGRTAPIALVVNPTMQCNLKCRGCYAYEYKKKDHMDKSLFKNILDQAYKLGTRLISVSGGEPFLYPHLMEVISEYPDMTFIVYTNGSLITKELATDIAKLGNLLPAISVEGFEAETNKRRGDKVYEKVMNAMSYLKKAGAFFGFSVTPTSENTDIIASDKFIEHYMDLGCLFGWFFNYIPVGLNPSFDLMPTPQQRNQLRLITRKWLREKPIFLGDFWNDGPCVGGCISANRYCYITVDGKVQPCTFVHFYTHDLKETSLREVFRSGLFKEIRKAQPISDNLLRPCMIIDSPEILREIVEKTNAQPSYPGAELLLESGSLRTYLDNYAEEWKNIADSAWKSDEYESGKKVLVPLLGEIDVTKRFPRLLDGKNY